TFTESSCFRAPLVIRRCASRHVSAVSWGQSSHRSITMRRRSLIMLSAAVLVGCTTERAAVPAGDSGGYALYSHQEEQQRNRVAAARRPAPEAFSRGAFTAVPELPIPTPIDAPSNMLIRTATASIEVDSLEIAVAQVKQLAAQFGGYVANSGVETGKKRLRNATLEVKIPVTRFDDALSGLYAHRESRIGERQRRGRRRRVCGCRRAHGKRATARTPLNRSPGDTGW